MKTACKIHGFACRMAFSLGLATFLIPKPQPNRANTYFFEPKPCILQCVCVFFYDVRVFEASGALRAAPRAPQGVPRGLQTLLGGPIGTSLGPCWAPRSPLGALLAPRGALDAWRHRGHSRGRFWQSPGALLGLFGAPGPHSRVFFLSGKAFCFGVLRHRTRSRNRLLVFSFGSFKSRVLGFSSGVLGFSSGVFGFSSGPVHGL